MLTNLQRVFKFAFIDFYRNKGISIAAIFILVITIVLVTSLFFLHGISNFIITEVENKIDIAAYFKSDTSEENILNIKDQIQAISPDIKSIEYVSKEEALNNFTQKHQDSSVFANALSQVGDNPFLPSLNITTTGTALAYEQIATILQSDQFASFIEKVDFSQKKDTIEKVFSITSNINTFGLGLAAILVFIAVLVVFNTIKLAIDNSKEEISTMKMVGASSWFVQGPFIVQGMLFGVVSFIICFLATMALAYMLSAKLAVVMPGFSLSDYFMQNLWLIVALQLGFGISLGVVSSFIVVNKYLKI